MGVFRMPSLGADMEAGKLAEWLVAPGDPVHRGDVIAVVETQKGAIEIEVFEDGTVASLDADLGQELPVGAPLATIAAEGEVVQPPPKPAASAEPAAAPSAVPPPPPRAEAAVSPKPAPPPAPPSQPVSPSVESTAPPGTGTASPAARVRAHELGLDLASIHGSGPGGAIVLSDVERPTSLTPTPTPTKKQSASPMDEMRKAIGAAMTRSKQTIPHIYLSQTIDLQLAADWLDARNADRPPSERILMGALFVRAAVLATDKIPTLNSRYTDAGFRLSETVNPGIAIALRGGGLVAPALMDARQMTLDDVMAGMRDLVSRARAGRLRSSEMTEGTITISALGETGAEMMAGIIFPPQVALIGIGAPQVRPWVVDGNVVPRTVVTVTVSADHRVADGRQVARFLAAFSSFIEQPESL